MDKIKLAVLGLNQGSKIARDAKANPEIEHGAYWAAQ